MLTQDRADWLGEAPDAAPESQSEADSWRRLEARIRQAAPAHLDVTGLPDAEQGYQPLVRSCATLARYAVLLAVWRMVDRGHSDGVELARLPEAELTSVEGWMKTAAHASLRRVFLSAPAALRFVSRNPQAIPSRIPAQLDEAGLLVRRKGKPWEIRYGRNATRPYNASGVNLPD
jgi:hypothetical protein